MFLCVCVGFFFKGQFPGHIIHDDVAGKSLAALTEVVKEMAALFPDEGFHLGGDEISTHDGTKPCPTCVAWLVCSSLERKRINLYTVRSPRMCSPEKAALLPFSLYADVRSMLIVSC